MRARHHEVKKGYLNDAGKELEMIITGAVTVESITKPPETHEFVAYALLVGSGFENPRIKKYQVLVPSPKH